MLSSTITTIIEPGQTVTYQDHERRTLLVGRVEKVLRKNLTPWLQVVRTDGRRVVAGLHELRSVVASPLS